ncbi:UDP-glucosyltransferase 2-like [Leptopilina heterotoma]|uniref:UDP-glucosyltransferase 2-like n=1 Tax=Leptopilina heterotoma TaxID=63436 RepID=UPI001CA89BBC|nr:UDP-glucosyltransferase 2-like [Leptopilina heterotoma]
MASLCLSIIMTIITSVIIKSNNCDGARILGLFPLNAKSHFILGEQIMKILAKNGHQVDVVSHFPQKEPVLNYRDLSLQGSIKDETNNMSYDRLEFLSPISLVPEIANTTGNNICKLIQHPILRSIIQNPPKNPPYDLVIVEIFTAPCYFAFARHLKVPMIGLITSVIQEWQNELLGNPDSFSFVPGGFTGLSLGGKMNFPQRLLNTLMGNLIKQQFHYYTADQEKFIDQYFGPGFPSIRNLSTQFSLVFVNSHYTLNGIRPLTPSIIEIGGVHIQDNEEKLSPDLQEWLDGSKDGCVYMSFGSMVNIETFPNETLNAFYVAFRKIAPVRILLKVGNEKKLPSGLPNNVKTNSWFPQIQILKHKNVKAFVTHGGLLGILESIYSKVPIIGFPLFGDQYYNLKVCEEKKFAISLNYDRFKENDFTEALNTVLKNSSYRKNIANFLRLYYDRPISSQDSVIFWVHYVLRHGNILRSPAVNLSWYQVELLDVYAFLLFSSLLLIYIFFLISRKLTILIYRAKKFDNAKIMPKKQK